MADNFNFLYAEISAVSIDYEQSKIKDLRKVISLHKSVWLHWKAQATGVLW